MTTWNIDPIHSEVKFKIKHLVISTVTGHFNEFKATIDTGKEDFTDATIAFSANVNSIDTKNTQRDGHLKSPDFFDSEKYPELTFSSKSITKKSATDYVVTGDLAIKGLSKQVDLDVVYNGTVKGFGGVDVSAFEISGKIKRQDYGLTWNGLTEAGGVVVSDDVKLEIFAEFNKA